jgi:hypothetical protein
VKLFNHLRRTRQPKIMMFIHLIMDIDLIVPLLIAARGRRDVIPIACITEEVLEQKKGFDETLRSLQIDFINFRGDQIVSGSRPDLGGVAAVISASESTANPHRAAHVLTKRANEAGIRTYTLQHGFDNIGLTYFDHVHTVKDIRFASQTIFIWGPSGILHKDVSPETRLKCVSVGCSKYVESSHGISERPGRRDSLIAIFENLHWHRYDSDYRQRFLMDLKGSAKAFPGVDFFVKPHPAGKWMTKRYTGPLPAVDNIVIVDPEDIRWRDYDGATILGMADGVITTPSTVALDSVRAGRPVGVIGYGLDLKSYEPLPIIRSADDWMTFIGQMTVAERRLAFEKKNAAFVERVLVQGDACKKIFDIIVADISG